MAFLTKQGDYIKNQRLVKRKNYLFSKSFCHTAKTSIDPNQTTKSETIDFTAISLFTTSHIHNKAIITSHSMQVPKKLNVQILIVCNFIIRRKKNKLQRI
tara:strand:- start:109 stop:408 length:300 start_codon:yes stop_codon:yes gene_type:complete